MAALPPRNASRKRRVVLEAFPICIYNSSYSSTWRVVSVPSPKVIVHFTRMYSNRFFKRPMLLEHTSEFVGCQQSSPLVPEGAVVTCSVTIDITLHIPVLGWVPVVMMKVELFSNVRNIMRSNKCNPRPVLWYVVLKRIIVVNVILVSSDTTLYVNIVNFIYFTQITRSNIKKRVVISTSPPSQA